VGFIIDSSVLVAAERGAFDVTTKLEERGADRAAVSAITASELLHGVHRAAPAATKNRREAFVEGLLRVIEILPFDELAARTHARIWAELAGRGINIGPHDLIIAATAIANGLVVATRDRRSFPKIPGLDLEVWDP
jgi:tRNA(fMet)-specific endonuclease VapC